MPEIIAQEPHRKSEITHKSQESDVRLLQTNTSRLLPLTNRAGTVWIYWSERL